MNVFHRDFLDFIKNNYGIGQVVKLAALRRTVPHQGFIKLNGCRHNKRRIEILAGKTLHTSFVSKFVHLATGFIFQRDIAVNLQYGVRFQCLEDVVKLSGGLFNDGDERNHINNPLFPIFYGMPQSKRERGKRLAATRRNSQRKKPGLMLRGIPAILQNSVSQLTDSHFTFIKSFLPVLFFETVQMLIQQFVHSYKNIGIPFRALRRLLRQDECLRIQKIRIHKTRIDHAAEKRQGKLP